MTIEEHRQQFLREIKELGLLGNLEIESEKEKDALKCTFDNSGNPVEITSSDWIKDPEITQISITRLKTCIYTKRRKLKIDRI